MYLKRLTVSNYKSFFEPKVLNFEPGFNVLLGANSSGKSSVLEAISFHQFENTPHRSILNMVDIDTQLTGSPTTELRLGSTLNELSKQVNVGEPLYIGIGDQTDNFHTQDPQFLERCFANEELIVDIKNDHSNGMHMRICFENMPSIWRNLNGSNLQFPGFQVLNGHSQGTQVSNFSVGSNDLGQIRNRIQPRIYRFSSERSVKHIYGHHPNSELLPDSSNLAYCINHLQSNNKDLFEDLNKLLRRVFPTIHWIGAPPNGGNQFELKVHTNPSSIKRGDLAVPINRVGTGVGNALAMLYVALTAQTPRFILLEEPNSYLHPRALRELLAILAEIGDKHQFFVTTHSSDVLRTINASTVTLLEYDGQQTTVQQTTGTKLHELQAGLIDLGISLTDLHGCDKVLWVEGETEEAIFPLILRHFFPTIAQGIAVLTLHATGDFEARKYRADKVAKIYKKLSQGSFLAPPLVTIALDREKKSISEIEKIEKESEGVIHFLPKTMFEDYLLDANAITAILTLELSNAITVDQVQAALDEAKKSNKCLLNPENIKSTDVHAANVLKFVFDKIGNLEYHKTRHGPQIFERILLNNPNDLLSLKDWFQKFL